MPSTYTSRLRLNAQAPGDNLNTWGLVLNAGVHQLLEDAVARRVAFALSGSKTLTTANGADDEARCAFLDVTSGSGGTITIPAVEKVYIVRNGASGDVIVTTGGGATATLKVGETVLTVCDAANVRRVQATDLGGARLTGLGTPTASTDGATKGYVDATAFNEVDLPGQDSNTDGAALFSDGTSARWRKVDLTDVQGYALAAAADLWAGTGDNVVAPSVVQDFLEPRSIAYAASLTLNLSNGRHFEVGTLTGNLALAFTGGSPGDTGTVLLKQDGTGNRTVTVSGVKAPNGLLSFSTDANAEDRLYYLIRSTGVIEVTLGRGFATVA